MFKNKGLKGFAIRLVIFMGIFLLTSFAMPYFKALINQDYYSVNQGFSSFMLYFIILIFLYAKKEKIKKSYAYSNKLGQTIGFALLSVLFFLIPFQSLVINFHLEPLIANYLLFGAAQFCLFLSVFNYNFPLKYMQEESLLIVLIVLGSLAMPLIIEETWTYFFEPIKLGVRGMLALVSDNYEVSNMENGFFVQLEEFRAGVGPSCSGIHSLGAFTILFFTSLIFLKGDREVIKPKAAGIYIAGLAILYFLNMIRITILLYVGAYISERLAIDLFHEYLSSIFLMSLFLIYLYFFIPKIFKKEGYLNFTF